MMKCLVLSFVVLFSSLISAQARTCIHCNSEVLETDNFCLSCGKDMSVICKFDVSSNLMANVDSGVRTPFKMSIATSLGVPWDDRCAVDGLDLAIFVSRNYSVYGIGISGLACYIKESVGLFFSGGGCVSEVIYGTMIAGALNISKEMYGLQISSLGNQSEEIYGMQIGFINRANKLRGIQIGVMNSAGDDISGIQIGCINEMGVKEDKVTLPLVNMRF